MGELERLREQIDKLDSELMDRIDKRAEIAKKIGKIKEKRKMSVLQEDRERIVLDHISNLAKNISPINAKLIWKEIMSACRQVQGEINKVAYLGPEGTFTQQAAMAFFAKGNTEFIPYGHKFEIVDEVEKKHVTYGILPIENSLHGSVTESLDLLIERNVKIYGEIEIPIIHNLIGFEGTELKEIKKIFSHPAVFAQVRTWVKKNVPNAKLIEKASTANAISEVKELGKKEIVAIGTKMAAKINDLSILEEGIEDDPSNFTRFVIISNKQQPPSEKDKTSMVFVTKHKPGALFNILRYFKEGNVNLTKLESRPRKRSKSSVWEYIFIVDFEGNPQNVKDVLKKVEQEAIWMKILGSYPKNQYVRE